MNNIKTVVAAMRPPFLILAAVSVLLGSATAYQETAALNYPTLLLALIGAIAAHISVNALNEYFDFKSGLDALTQKTPFSGGSGALSARPQAAPAVLVTAVGALLVTIAIGLFFIVQHGAALLPLGLLGTLIVISYTPYLNRHPLLCLLAPGVGFGPLMVLGTHYVLTGHYTLPALLASLLPFFLANNLLLLNQFPDAVADREVGRRTAPVIYGYRASSRLYALFLLLAASAPTLAVVAGQLPSPVLLALPLLLPAITSQRAAERFSGNHRSLLQAMKFNVMVAIGAPTALGLTLFFS